ncbi:flagellar hook assembly protein FlgD [Acuticoccus sp.]|uniref:flagellar hook assembly protein FlgD n=1 Tax=Acuticoccus sp. TaxID=1904378 RepID=UPI003B5277AE
MTSIAAVGPTDTRPSSGVVAPGTTPTLDYDAFLKLLVTQMQNQDPLEPMSDTEYIAQLATFSNVEQNILTNKKLEAMMTANALGDAGSLIGRTVTTADGASGTVEKVQITANGSQAILTDGRVLPFGDGMTVG